MSERSIDEYRVLQAEAQAVLAELKTMEPVPTNSAEAGARIAKWTRIEEIMNEINDKWPQTRELPSVRAYRLQAAKVMAGLRRWLD